MSYSEMIHPTELIYSKLVLSKRTICEWIYKSNSSWDVPKIRKFFTISFYEAFVLTFVLDISLEITIIGSGSSFPHEVYKLWQSSYLTFRKNYVTLEMQYHATGGTVAKDLLYKNKNIQYASLETVISKNELRQHLDIVEFPVVAGYVISVLFRIWYSHNDCR